MITEIIQALPAGEIIKNPEKYKVVGQVGNYASVILTLSISAIKLKYPDFFFPEEFNAPVLVIIAGILGYINTVIAKITTRKDIGISQVVK